MRAIGTFHAGAASGLYVCVGRRRGGPRDPPSTCASAFPRPALGARLGVCSLASPPSISFSTGVGGFTANPARSFPFLNEFEIKSRPSPPRRLRPRACGLLFRRVRGFSARCVENSRGRRTGHTFEFSRVKPRYDLRETWSRRQAGAMRPVRKTG